VSVARFGAKEKDKLTLDKSNCLTLPDRHHVVYTFKWNVTGELGTAIDWVGINEYTPCSDPNGCLPGKPAGVGYTAWSYLSGSQEYEKSFKPSTQGEIKVAGPINEDSHTSFGKFVAHFYVNDDYDSVAHTEPFDIKPSCEKQLLGGFAFLILMGCVAGIALVAIIALVIVKKYGGLEGLQLGSGKREVKYAELNKDEDSSHEEYDNQLSITSSDEDK